MNNFIKSLLGALLIPAALLAQTTAKPTNVHVSAGLVSTQFTGTTRTAADCTKSAMQTTIDASSSRDIVQFPDAGCSVTWSANVTVPSTIGIKIDGRGNTTLNGFGFTMAANATVSTRITGISFTNCNPDLSGVDNSAPLKISQSYSTAIWRLDHNTFPITSSNNTCLKISDNGQGLVDHNTFTTQQGSTPNELIHNFGFGTDPTGWSDDLTPGSSAMIFIEDNTFTHNPTGNPAYYFGTSAVQAYNGARTVFRHNTLENMQIDQHGTPGHIGARWFEIYNNNFGTAAAHSAQSNYIVIRGGSGVIFNNTHTGLNCEDNSCGNISIFEEDTDAYPSLYQPGRGYKQRYSPVYVWNNASTMPYAPDNTTQIQNNRDAFNSVSQPGTLVTCQKSADGGTDAGAAFTCPTSLAYTIYTYPHPAQTSVQ